jgi:hypothetical protein
VQKQNPAITGRDIDLHHDVTPPAGLQARALVVVVTLGGRICMSKV